MKEELTFAHADEYSYMQYKIDNKVVNKAFIYDRNFILL